MNSILDAENRAVLELESSLKAAKWEDGWRLTDAEIASYIGPIYYRNSTPASAADAKVMAGDQEHSLYMVFSVTDTKTYYASNTPSFFDVTLALTFYYDEPYLFYDTGQESIFKGFIDELLTKLAEGQWSITSEGESAVTAAGDRGPYTNRKVLFITKNI